MSGTFKGDVETQLRSRDHYYYFREIATRWIDNDVYGHVNNANYYQFFDTVVNAYLIENAKLDFRNDNCVAFVVASSCQYRSPIAHPVLVHAGMRINRLGNSSVEYGVALFAGSLQSAAAYGTFTHVYVDRKTGESVHMPNVARSALTALFEKQQ